MRETDEKKIVLVKRSTRLEELVKRFNTVMQAKFYLEHLGADFSDYLREDEVYKVARCKAESVLNRFGRVQIIDRFFLSNFIFGRNDLVVAIGQDGMVANTMKYLDNQLLIGVNPDPKRYDGVLLPFVVENLSSIIPETLRGKRRHQEVTMAKAQLNDGQTLYAVNDFFIGQKTHVSARYRIHLGQYGEQQSSSGIIVSTGLGSTGWLKSIIKGATTISTSFIQRQNVELESDFKLPWDADYLYFSVREPFPSKASQAGMVFGRITPENSLKILSQMPDNGVIFSDGIESDFLSFNSGVEAEVTVAEKKGKVVV